MNRRVVMAPLDTRIAAKEIAAAWIEGALGLYLRLRCVARDAGVEHVVAVAPSPRIAPPRLAQAASRLLGSLVTSRLRAVDSEADYPSIS